MAVISTIKCSLLVPPFVLAPERYDPRRELSAAMRSVPLGEIAQSIRQVVQPPYSLGPCLVLDTSDAREGVIIARKTQTEDIGSAKKRLQPRDVIISRLRPYLRQVAYVDDAIPNADGAVLLCSTEFFVLRAIDERPISFLVPFLLSAQVQSVLAASQEGGHHPRFDDSTLFTLPVPVSLIDDRRQASDAVEKAVMLYRQSERILDDLVAGATRSLALSGGGGSDEPEVH